MTPSIRSLMETINTLSHFVKVKLPVPIIQMAGVFSGASLKLHYNTLYRNYVSNANETGEQFQVDGANLHQLYFEQFMKPKPTNIPFGASKDLIDSKFGNFNNFKDAFAEIATSIHGSGWAYLTLSGKIKTIPNHKALPDVAVIIDMWEHAFVIDFGANKHEYLEKMWTIIDWDIINKRII